MDIHAPVERSTFAWSWLIALGLLSSLGGCDGAIAEPEQCGTVRLTDGVLMRLSRSHGHPDSIPTFTVRACDVRREDCVDVAIYDHSLPPAYSVEDDKLVVELLGGQVRKRRTAPVTLDKRRYDVEVRQITGQVSKQNQDAFLARIGFPPATWVNVDGREIAIDATDACLRARRASPD